MLEPDTKKAQLIPLSKLPTVVDAAVKAAQERLGGGSPGKIIKKWEILGRVARTLDDGQKFADAVTANITKQGFQAKPALLRLDKIIIAGFIEPPNIPFDRQF